MHQYLDVIRRWVWLLALCMLLGGVSAFAVSKLLQPTYRATALLVVGPPSFGSDPNSALLASDQLVTTYMGLITQPVILQRAAAQVHGVTAQQLARQVDVKDQAGTQLIELDVDNASPVRAAQLANAIAVAFIGMQQEASSASLARAQQQVNQQLAQVSAQIATLTAQSDALRSQNPGSPRLQVLQQQLNAALAHQAALQTVSSQLTTQQVLAPNSVNLFQPATPPTAPDHPKPLENAAIGAVLGLVLAGALIWLLEYFDDRLRTPLRAEERLGLPVLGAVGTYPRGALLTDLSAPNTLSREMDLLVAHLPLSDPPWMVAVTSASAGEGKTTVAVNLAVALAHGGRRVLLVDGDLHGASRRAKGPRGQRGVANDASGRASFHEIVDVTNAAGLSTVATQDVQIESVVSSVSTVPNLFVLPSGPELPDPSSVLGSSRIRHRFQELMRDRSGAHIDVLVIDTPAATEYADAALMATWVDALLVVVDATRSRAGTVLHAMDMLTRAHGTIAGVVLNRVQARDHTVDGTVSSQQTWTGNHRQAEPVGLQNETQEHPFDTVAVEPHSTRDGNLPELTPTAGS